MYFFFFESRAIYEIMWENMVEPDRPQMTIWHVRFVCWISRATDAHSEYVTVIAFPRQQRLRQRASVLHVLCLSFSWFNGAVNERYSASNKNK